LQCHKVLPAGNHPDLCDGAGQGYVIVVGIITVEVVSQSGTDTLKIDRTILLNPYSFLASWEIPTGGPSGSVDFYFGMLSPDSKTVYTWVRQDGGYVLVKGLRPIDEGVNLNTPGTYRTSEIGGGA
jgi:hypothetical protein